MSHKENQINRRSALRGAAWTAPVIALAVATPAHAASGTVRLKFDTAQNNWKWDNRGNVIGITTKIQVQNIYAQPETDARSVVVSILYPAEAVTPGALTTIVGAGWTHVGTDGLKYMFAYAPPVPSSRSTSEVTITTTGVRTQGVKVVHSVMAANAGNVESEQWRHSIS